MGDGGEPGRGAVGSVGPPEVDGAHGPGVEQIQGPERGPVREPEVAGEVVAGPGGYHGHHAAGAVGRGSGEVTDRAVAPAHHHAVAGVECSPGELHGGRGIGGHVHGDPAAGERVLELAHERGAAPPSRTGVDHSAPAHRAGR